MDIVGRVELVGYFTLGVILRLKSTFRQYCLIRIEHTRSDLEFEVLVRHLVRKSFDLNFLLQEGMLLFVDGSRGLKEDSNGCIYIDVTLSIDKGSFEAYMSTGLCFGVSLDRNVCLGRRIHLCESWSHTLAFTTATIEG